MLLWNKICGIISVFFLSTLCVSAQEVIVAKDHFQKVPQQYVSILNLSSKTNANPQPVSFQPLSVIPQNYYTQHFGIMCKQELKIEKATKIPFRFRLGSLQQCNYYEGKK